MASSQGRARLYRNSLAASAILLAMAGAAVAQPTPGVSADAGAVKALPFVAPIFGDNMVIQRGKADTIWGWSEPGDTVRVEIGDRKAETKAGADGRWQVELTPPGAPGPYVMRITGRTHSLALNNVLVGDVWIGGGQSNMELPLRFARDAEAEIKAADAPDIRYFKVSGHAAYHHTDLIEGSWKVVSPETADAMSAVGYYFARNIEAETKRPIGLVVDAVGGTPAEAWASAQSLEPLKDFDAQLAELKRLADSGAPEYGNFVMHWYDRYDVGLKGGWKEPGFDDSAWTPVTIPGGFAELGVPEAPALVWFRKEITLPDPLPAGRAAIALGSIERMDTVFINGVSVGASAWVENPRFYFIPDGVLKPGRNTVAVRVLKTKPAGGWPVVIFQHGITQIFSLNWATRRSRWPAPGRGSSASTPARRSPCRSATRTGPSCRRCFTKACSSPSRLCRSPAPSGTRASRIPSAAISTARSCR